MVLRGVLSGPGLTASSLGSRADRDTRPAGVGVAAAASLSSGCHWLAYAPHPAPGAAAATTAAGERCAKDACAAYVELAQGALRSAGGANHEVALAHARSGCRSRTQQRRVIRRVTRCPNSLRTEIDTFRAGARAALSTAVTHTQTLALRSPAGRHTWAICGPLYPSQQLPLCPNHQLVQLSSRSNPDRLCMQLEEVVPNLSDEEVSVGQLL
ncbi:uncharacterized protein LOC116589257 [Mustela erminea]|uniref:uncharacterized protein LOC116589257 n=1 Tax=Mustela erminea TaxID=36723 RepID=UPI001386B130|nr:uncharacterized protein LOC116589257 [Mustela erminea]